MHNSLFLHFVRIAAIDLHVWQSIDSDDLSSEALAKEERT